MAYKMLSRKKFIQVKRNENQEQKRVIAADILFCFDLAISFIFCVVRLIESHAKDFNRFILDVFFYNAFD